MASSSRREASTTTWLPITKAFEKLRKKQNLPNDEKRLAFFDCVELWKMDVFEEGTREGGKNGKAKQQMDQWEKRVDR